MHSLLALPGGKGWEMGGGWKSFVGKMPLEVALRSAILGKMVED